MTNHENLEQQEHLSLKKLQKLIVKPSHNNLIDDSDRPSSNFIDLMKWVEHKFSFSLKNQSHLERLVHNRIVIDGSFMQFAEEHNLKIKCLYKDSIVSWAATENNEKFFSQGVFHIYNDQVEFLQASLFHKGTYSEDEICFFVICSHDNYQQYLDLRNQYDAWAQNRDRENLFIRVMDGEDLPYDRSHTWDDLFLPANQKRELKNTIESFLASKEWYAQNKLPWKLGILLSGAPGNGKSSCIRTIISQYNFKPITISSVCPPEVLRDAFQFAEQYNPSLLYFEDLDALIDGGLDVSSLLNLLDGVSSKNGLVVIATTNNIKRLKSNITNRPSRFDRKFEIALPTQEEAIVYLKKWFGSTISAAKYRDLAKCAEKYFFSYAYLKEIYISSMFEALSHKRKVPNDKDIDIVINRLIRENDVVSNERSSIDTDKYFS